MVGTYADVVIADAILKDIPGFDRELAWQAMHKDSYEAGGKKGQGGKLNYQDYASFGYIPAERPDSVSGTLDFAFSDFAVSLAATKLGHPGEADELHRRAVNAKRQLFDVNSGLMRPKGRGGFFIYKEPHMWGNGFTEGSAWHHSFPAFDLPGLVGLHGSPEKLARRIVELTDTPGTFVPGSYKLTIHEMEEMRALGLGQYAHNNQPVHHVLFLLAGLDEAQPKCTDAAHRELDKAEDAFCPRLISENMVHKVLQRAYGLEFYGGDEDNGEMGAWYVLASLGLFEPAPGTKHGYSLGSPLFRHVNVHRKKPDASEGPALTILSHWAGGAEARHVTRVLLNDKDVALPASSERAGWTISYEDLFRSPQAGVTLRFLTGAEQAGETAPIPTAGGSAQDEEVQRLRKQLQQEQASHQRPEQQQQQQPQVAAAPAPPPPKPEAQLQYEARSQVRQQQILINQLENQLKRQALESKRTLSRTDADIGAGLSSSVYVAFGILVIVNGIGWFMCTQSRVSGKKNRTRPVATSRHRGNRRKHDEGLDV
jgi:hypothetical protein